MSGKPKTRSVLLKSVLIGICCLLVGYLLVLMYAQGEYLFALLTLILSATGLWILLTVAPMRGVMSIPAWREWRCLYCSPCLHDCHCLYQLQQQQPAHL